MYAGWEPSSSAGEVLRSRGGSPGGKRFEAGHVGAQLAMNVQCDGLGQRRREPIGQLGR